MSKNRQRLSNEELALIEHVQANVLDAMHNLQRATAQCRDPEVFSHLSGAWQALTKIDRYMRDWKPVRFGEKTITDPMNRDQAIDALTEAMQMTDTSFKTLAAIRQLLQSENIADEIINEDEKTETD